MNGKWFLTLVLFAFVAGLGLTGCEKQETPAPETKPTMTKPTETTPAPTPAATAEQPAEPTPAATPAETPAADTTGTTEPL